MFKKPVLSIAILGSLSLLVVFYNTQVQPLAEKQVLSQIQNLSQKYKIKTQWEEIKVQPLILRVVLKEVQVPQLQSSIPYLSVQIAPLRSLLKNQLLFNIKIRNMKEKIEWKTSPNSSSNILTQLPFSKIQIQNSSIKVKLQENDFSLQEIKLSLKNNSPSLLISLKTQLEINESLFQTQTQLTLNKNQIKVQMFKIEKKDNYFSFNGQINLNRQVDLNKQTNSFLVSQIENAQLNTQGLFLDQDFKTLAHIFNYHKMDSFYGLFNIQSEFTYSKDKGFLGKFKTEADDFSWNHISISKIKTEGDFNPQRVYFNLAHLEKENEWRIFSDQTLITLNKNLSFKTQTYNHITSFPSFENFFKLQTGVKFNGHSDSTCKGSLRNLSVDCSIEGTLYNLTKIVGEKEVFSAQSPFNFKGGVVWTDLNKKFFGKLNSSQSKPQSKFEFETQINNKILTSFKGDLNLSDFHHISNLDLNGQVQVKKGKASFSKNRFQAQAQLSGQKFKMNNFSFGNIQTPVNLTQSFIHFKKIKGRLENSIYNGAVQVFFNKTPRLHIQSEFSPLYLQDLQKFLGSNLKLPVELSGLGKGSLNARTPLDWSQIQYDLKSEFQNFYIEKEFFQSGQIHLSAQNGKAQFKNSKLQKIKGNILISGFIKDARKLNIQVQGSQIIIEKILYLKKWIHPNLSGLFDFKLDIKSTFKNPRIKLLGKLKNLMYFSSPLEPGEFNVTYRPSSFKARAELFNKKLIVDDFKWSLKNQSLSMLAKAQDLNFMPFIVNSLNSMNSHLTGETSLSFSKGRLASGYLNVQNIHLKQNNQYLKSNQPLYLQFKNKNFTFRGSSLSFETNTTPLVFEKITPDQSLITGPVQLTFLTLLFPYIDYAHGTLDVHLSIDNRLQNWNPKGGLQIKQGSLKIGSLIDPLSDIEFEGVLNSQELEVTKFKARTLTGNISSSGSIRYPQKNKFPINLKGKFNQFGLNLSKNTRVQGSGSYVFFGDKWPYTLKGDFNLIDGHFKQNFESDESLEEPLSEVQKQNWVNLDIQAFIQNPFLIENSLITTSVRGALRLKGSYLSPIATGEVSFLPGGFFNVKEYEFEITQGNVQYNQNSILNPRFDIVGQTNFEDVQYIDNKESTQNYQITAQIYGQADSFKFNLSSDPYLSETDIISMMALGARSIGLSGQTPIGSYFQVASLLFQDTIGKKLEKILGFRLSIVPYINSNQPTKVKARKRWSKNLVTSVSSSLSAIDEIDRSLKVEYSLTPRLSLLGTWAEFSSIGSQTPTTQEEYNFEIEYKIDF